MYQLRFIFFILSLLFLQGCTEIKPNSSFVNCSDTEFRCLNKFYCIHKTWLCDGDTDCPDGSDESVQICGTEQECRSDQFICDNGACIPGHLQCSGKAECSDGSDEKMCRKYKIFELIYFYVIPHNVIMKGFDQKTFLYIEFDIKKPCYYF